jgi:hypothetical protein
MCLNLLRLFYNIGNSHSSVKHLYNLLTLRYFVSTSIEATYM